MKHFSSLTLTDMFLAVMSSPSSSLREKCRVCIDNRGDRVSISERERVSEKERFEIWFERIFIGGFHLTLHRILGTARSNMSFEDRRVCRPFLLSCCPHEILTGTVSSFNSDHLLSHPLLFL